MTRFARMNAPYEDHGVYSESRIVYVDLDTVVAVQVETRYTVLTLVKDGVRVDLAVYTEYGEDDDRETISALEGLLGTKVPEWASDAEDE